MASRLLGKEIGNFTVLDVQYTRTKNKNGKIYFKARCTIKCKCGQTKDKSLTNILSDRVIGCGVNCSITSQATKLGQINGGLKRRKPKPPKVSKIKKYRGKTCKEWTQILGITKQAFHLRLKKWGAENYSTYVPKLSGYWDE